MGKFFIRWSKQLAISHPQIDKQHQGLFLRIEALIHSIMKKRGDKESLDLLFFLKKYTKDHFTYEEAYMARKKYPGLVEHKQQHDTFVASMAEMQRISFEDSDQDISQELNEKLGEWLRTHILIEDTRMMDWVKGNRGDYHITDTGLRIERRR
jgi:hemerythrin